MAPILSRCVRERILSPIRDGVRLPSRHLLFSLPESEPDPNDCIFTEVGRVYREVCE